ncbi:MAG: GNAT family N-acetyltransferase [Acidobacteriota bacterium]|nr:GNAT family N-acetyltransferase [Acidobacteriota bacterium]
MLETERLILRRITPGDLDALIATREGDEVNKYLGGARMQNPEAIAERMKFYLECHEKHGFGMCMVIWKETGEIIGWSGLQPLGETGEIEVGYGMKKEFWGRGIGYECALAWLRYGFENIGAERIVALAHPDNVGSWRIMEKCGMRYEKNTTHFGMECVLYAITKDEFLSRFPK